MAATVLFTALLLFIGLLRSTEAQIGVCYGMNGNNLPLEQQVVNLYPSNGIQLMRMYSADLAALQALQGSGIQLLLDTGNDQLQNLAADQSQATLWVQTNVTPFAASIRYIGVGNEVPSSLRQYVVPAMQNVQNALNEADLGQIKVSTVIFSGMIVNSFPPSNGVFEDTSFMDPVVNFLTINNSPMLVNIYPYFSYIGSSGSIRQDYALFTAPGAVVTDVNNGLEYQNLFDALVDSVYAALAKAGGENTAIVVAESGWPSDGGDSASLDNAGTYYANLINHIWNGNGTPLKPGLLETYLFAMFDENLKPGLPTEQHFGLFSPITQQPKFDQLSFTK